METIDLTTVVFGLLAAFVVWKLRSVLGAKTGDDHPPLDNARRTGPETGADGNVIRLPGAANDAGAPGRPDPRTAGDRWAPFAAPGTPVWLGLDEIVARDQHFDPREFLEGAKAAYEMIVSAFAKGDQQTLRDLLAKDVFDSFVAAINERNARGETVESTFVALDKATFSEVQLRGSTAHIAVKFNSQLITATRRADGSVIDGNPDKPVDMVDVWTFARDLSSRDPNWRLVATEAGH